MTRLERLAQSGKEPIVCPSRLTPSGTPLLLAEHDQAFIYLWCRSCRCAHAVRIKTLARGTVKVSEDIQQQSASARDTQFAGFAALLVQEIDKQVGAVTEWGIEHDIDSGEKVGQELYSRWQTIIARRAYDLVQHAVGYSLEYLDECGKEISGSMDSRIQPSIPDLTAWPKEEPER